MSTIELGGNIKLEGFNELDGGSMVIIRKMVGNHVRKLTDSMESFEELSLKMQKVQDDNGNYEITAEVIAEGTPVTTKVKDFNLFFTLDKALTQVSKDLLQ